AGSAVERVDRLGNVLARSTADPALEIRRQAIRQGLHELDERLRGNSSQRALSAPREHSIGDRLSVAQIGTRYSTYGPTPNLSRSLEIAAEQLDAWEPEFAAVVDREIPALERDLDAAGVPWTPGRPLP
ncbi:MAG TPA: glycosyl hydrolase, partial [Thermoanaerobaculia bacterium]|nr:glycosyl hydrolase [Thermoanaerobaculia bacterium]